jgi:hypothetical protein
MRGTWQTTSGGGGGGGEGAAVAVLALFIVAVFGSAIAAVMADVLRVLELAAIIAAGVALAATAGVVVWRVRHRSRPAPWTVTAVTTARPTQVLAPPSHGQPAARAAIGRGSDVHLHLHGLNPADIAAALAHLNDSHPDDHATYRGQW